MNLKTVFMGSPDFALPTLQTLAQNTQLVGVVTQPDRQAGRGRLITSPAVKLLAEDLGIVVFQPRTLRTDDAYAKLTLWDPDCIVVAAYGQILRQNILDLPRYGCINVHASLLPRWRGAAPINAAILHGDTETGITIMKMNAGLDTGPILSQSALPIHPTDTAGALSEKLAILGSELLLETLPKYISGEVTPSEQTESGSTYAPMLSKKDGEMDFNHTAENLGRMVRAYHPWPGTFTFWKNQPLKILEAYSTTETAGKPGEKTVIKDLPAISTSSGTLVLTQLQPAGKKSMSGQVFLNGARDWLTSS